MARPIDTKMSSIIEPFIKYSKILAEQLDILQKRSNLVIHKSDINEEDLVTQTQSAMRQMRLDFLAVIPLIFEELDEQLKGEFILKGLNAVLEGENNNTFIHILNKEALKHFGAKKAEVIDLSFSRILAFHTGNKVYSPVASFYLHLRFKALSPVLANHIAALGIRSIQGDGNPYTLKYERLRKSLLSLHEMLPIIMNKLPQRIVDKIFSQGLNCFNGDDYNHIEYLGVNESINSKKLAVRFDDALTNIKNMHFNKECKPYSHIYIPQKSINLSRAMVLSFDEFSELKNITQLVSLELVNESARNQKSAINIINKTVNCLLYLLQNELKGQRKNLTIKERLQRYPQLVNNYIEKRSSFSGSFYHFLKRILPSVYGEHHNINLHSEEQFNSYLLSISEEFAQQYTKFLNSEENLSAGRLSFMKSFAKYLEKHQKDEKITIIINMIAAKGVNGLNRPVFARDSIT